MSVFPGRKEINASGQQLTGQGSILQLIFRKGQGFSAEMTSLRVTPSKDAKGCLLSYSRTAYGLPHQMASSLSPEVTKQQVTNLPSSRVGRRIAVWLPPGISNKDISLRLYLLLLEPSIKRYLVVTWH